MSTWVLEGFNTDSRYRDDVRHREYTTSKRTADLFDQIPKIQFTDSGHGIVFQASPHSGRKLPTRRMEYVGAQMARLRAEATPAKRPATVKRSEIVTRLLDAQAELQTGLGMFRLDPTVEHIEGYLARSLAMQQRLLALLGNPMLGGPTEDVERHA